MTSEQRQVWHAAAIALIIAALLYERHHHSIRRVLADAFGGKPKPAARPVAANPPGPPWTTAAGLAEVYPLACAGGPRTILGGAPAPRTA